MHQLPLPPGIFLVLIFTRGWVNSRAMVQSEGNVSLKNPVTRPGINPGTFWLVAQRLKHYATPHWHTWVEKVMEMVVKDTFLYWHEVHPPFSCNTTCIVLEIDSYKFWIVCSGILFYPSWRTSCSCLRHTGGGNLHLIVLTKIDHSYMMMIKYGDCAGHGRCWSASSFSSNQDLKLLAVCVWANSHLGKLLHC